MAAAMQMGAKASGGDPKSIAQFLDWVDEIEKRAAAAKPVQFPFAPADLEVLQETYERIKLRSKLLTKRLMEQGSGIIV